MPSILSLCSGIAALDIAVAAHYGAEIKWFSEIDEEASQVLSHRFPKVPNLGDLTKINPKDLDPDIVVAGFPCTTVSAVGKQKGTDDDRWVSDEIISLIDGLENRPTKVIFENVVQLLSNKKGETVRPLFRALAELGFSLKWGVVQARDAKAPHRRSRVFVLATNTDDSELQRHGKHSVLECPTAEESRQRMAEILATSFNSTSLDRTHNFNFGKFEQAIRQWELELKHPAPVPIVNNRLNEYFSEWMMGIPGWVTGSVEDQKARFRLTGNAVVPHQALTALAALESIS